MLEVTSDDFLWWPLEQLGRQLAGLTEFQRFCGGGTAVSQAEALARVYYDFWVVDPTLENPPPRPLAVVAHQEEVNDKIAGGARDCFYGKQELWLYLADVPRAPGVAGRREFAVRVSRILRDLDATFGVDANLMVEGRRRVFGVRSQPLGQYGQPEFYEIAYTIALA